MVELPTAVVLAGGVGSRLAPLTRVVPKPLVPFAGSPLIDYIVESLKSSGFSEVVVTARYLGEQIVEHFRGFNGVRALLIDSKDTADAVRLVSGLIKGDFLVSMGDVVSNIPYNSFYKYHLDHGGIASIVLKEVDNPLPYGLVYVDSNSNIILFSEKPASLEIYLVSLAFHSVKSPVFFSNLVNAGIYAFKEELLSILIDNPGLMDFGRHVFPYLLESGYSIKGWIAPHNTYWIDIGRVEVYVQALWDLLDDKIPGWRPRGKLVAKGLYMSEDAEINATLYPPVYIGSGVIVGEGSIVGPYTVLEGNVVVEAGSRVSYSIIWHNSRIRRNAYIHSSLLMNNTEINEGVKVLSSIIGSGCFIESDVLNKTVQPCTLVSPYEVEG